MVHIPACDIDNLGSISITNPKNLCNFYYNRRVTSISQMYSPINFILQTKFIKQDSPSNPHLQRYFPFFFLFFQTHFESAPLSYNTLLLMLSVPTLNFNSKCTLIILCNESNGKKTYNRREFR